MKRSSHNAEYRLLIVAVLFCVLAGVFYHYGLTDLITNFHHLQDVIRQSGLFGYTLYILLFIVAALCLILAASR